MKTIKKITFYTFVYCIVVITGCKSTPENTLNGNGQKNTVITSASTDKGAYNVSEQVKLTFSFSNEKESAIAIKNIVVQVKNISNASSPVVYEKKIDTTISLDTKQKYALDNIDLWKIPADAATNAYGIYLQYELDKSTQQASYMSFFRIVKDTDFTTYRIDHSTYKELDVYALHGGMSAECVVEKAVENLKPGVAHSWFLNAPGSGPEHVLATPQFLQNSVKQTVDFYNKSLGENTKFETVVVGPGLEAIPYLSLALKAPVLPLHFLASCNTVKEIQSILDYSNDNGYVSYATLGHDYSVPFAVAWVKLLDMPEEYTQFLKQHQVKNIVFVGYAGADGENTAKKVANNAAPPQYSAGSLFILYPGGGSKGDMDQLQEKIVDFNSTAQQKDFVQIADWESGIIQEQITQISKKAKEELGIVNTRYITTKDMIHLWDLATYVSVSFIHKNNKTFTKNGDTPIKGISVNPYFVANSFYEIYNKFVPLIYWQHNSKEHTVSRIVNVTGSALAAYFPKLKTTDLTCWINSSNNFDGVENARKMKSLVQSTGFNNIMENDYTKDDIWDPSDGLTSPVETRVSQLANSNVSAQALKQWSDNLQPLSLEDLDKIGKNFPEILVK